MSPETFGGVSCYFDYSLLGAANTTTTRSTGFADRRSLEEMAVHRVASGSSPALGD
jgi:hypothetical protein